MSSCRVGWGTKLSLFGGDQRKVPESADSDYSARPLRPQLSTCNWRLASNYRRLSVLVQLADYDWSTVVSAVEVFIARRPSDVYSVVYIRHRYTNTPIHTYQANSRRLQAVKQHSYLVASSVAWRGLSTPGADCNFVAPKSRERPPYHLHFCRPLLIAAVRPLATPLSTGYRQPLLKCYTRRHSVIMIRYHPYETKF